MNQSHRCNIKEHSKRTKWSYRFTIKVSKLPAFLRPINQYSYIRMKHILSAHTGAKHTKC